MGLLPPCSLHVRRRRFVALLLGYFLSDHVVLGLCAVLHTAYQFYHTIHESIALIF